jgi:hypothetical protein
VILCGLLSAERVGLMASIPSGEFSRWSPHWGQWLQEVTRVTNNQQRSGTTLERPDKQVRVGDFYYDTDLGKPVWIDSVDPIVWHDGSGSVV